LEKKEKGGDGNEKILLNYIRPIFFSRWSKLQEVPRRAKNKGGGKG
jgi:hypothetical protein